MLLLLQEEDTTIGISPRLRVLSRDLSSSLRVAAVVAVAVSVVQGGMKRRDINGDSINKAQLKDFWDQISDQSFDSRLKTVFDMVDKDADGRLAEEEIK
ncbi:hypothetical protein HN51_040458 [Arachis hypogaea]